MSRSRWAAALTRGLLVLGLGAVALGLFGAAASSLELTAPDALPFATTFDCTNVTAGDGVCPAPTPAP